MPTIEELQPLLGEPREDLAVEYKTWLDLSNNEDKARIAKAAIALANHGGGFIVIGFEDQNHRLVPLARPANIPAVSQDGVNAAIRRFADPEFHCEMHNVPHPATQDIYPIIAVPGGMSVPVMSGRDCPGVIFANRCYTRKPGPRSEEPQTAEEWRTLLQKCLLAGREDMLDAIRAIVSGRVEPAELPPNAREQLHAFCEAARARWAELVRDLPNDAPARFPHGHYDMGFSLVGAQPANGLNELQARIEIAHRIKLTGWPAFLTLNRREWTPYPHEDFVEAWVGRTTAEGRNFEDPAHSDFWRISRDGKLYSVRGYHEDATDRVPPGRAFDVTLPVWRIAEGLLFAARLAETFEGVDAIAVECNFTGLNNRYLTSLNGNRALFNDRISRSDQITLTGEVSLEQVRDNLSEFMQELLRPLYERFDFFPLSRELVDTELGHLRGGRF